MHTDAWEALGTTFKITIWDDLPAARFAALAAACVAATQHFDALYSRFKPDSLITALSTQSGTFEVPQDLTRMLRHYETLYAATDGAMTPAIGFALEDTGYDADYTLRPKDVIRITPPLEEVLTINDDTHLTLHAPTLLDLGALGKGYLVDQLYELLRSEGCERFLIDGSGDIRYHATDGEAITCGLEHPFDDTLAIGTLTITHGALCASALNRRAWEGHNHYLDPRTNTSPIDTAAVWVYAETATLADALSTALFFIEPPSLQEYAPFEYLLLDHKLNAKSSAGFAAELFAAE